ncbi:MAG: type I restriction-modification system subunit M [Candidatus Gastranaerophilales bacterium]|nr:type I restriction-modification system subunit M [Candidatus Gastranaerophilales bacterium]
MTDREFKAIIDELWNTFWSSGISNPISVVEQMTYLIFFKMFEEQENLKQKKAAHYKKERKSFFEGRENLRWSNFKELDSVTMLKTYKDKVFPLLEEINPALKDSVCLISKPSLLDTAVQTLDKMDFSDGNDRKGDIYEYMLDKLAISGQNGQFRTPRHIIDMMTKLVDPRVDDKICDPACGSGGFLCGAYRYILESNTSDEMKEVSPIFGDNLSDEHRKNLDNNVFFGGEFDPTMYKIGLMNMILHNIKTKNIKYQDSLSKDAQEEDKYTLILANPPFTGSIDESDIDPHITAVVKTKKTELLFMAKFLKMLEVGGRAAVIIPTGVLSTESNAHKTLRQKLIEENQLEAVISMPSGVFKPYAGVATAVLVFTKGGQTQKTWFYEMENDGFTLDDKRTVIADNDIPDIIEKFATKQESAKSFNVTIEDLREGEYNLLPSRYKKIEYVPPTFEHTPQEYIQMLLESEKKSIQLLEKLQKQLGGRNV